MGVLDLFGVGPVADLANKILSYFPDAQQRADAQKHLEDLVSAVQTQQSAVNLAEANSGNVFVSGWRPFIGWVCAIGFTYSIAMPVFHGQPLDTITLNNLLWGMLGLGAYRSADKLGGVATTAIKKLLGK